MVYAHRFFAEDVLFGLGGADGPFAVMGMRRGDVDDIDVGIGEEGFVTAMRVGKLVEPGKFVGLGLDPAGNGDEFALFRAKDAAGEFMRDGAGADDSPTKLGHSTMRRNRHFIVAEVRSSASR